MKAQLLSAFCLLSGSLFFSHVSFGQCPNGDVTLVTQAQVNQFANSYPNCTTIAGALTIGGRSQESVSSCVAEKNGEHRENDAAMSVFPNPTNGMFSVSIPNAPGGHARLFDLNGRLLAQQRLGEETQFDLSTRPAGVYWLDVRFDDKTSRRQKIVRE